MGQIGPFQRTPERSFCIGGLDKSTLVMLADGNGARRGGTVSYKFTPLQYVGA